MKLKYFLLLLGVGLLAGCATTGYVATTEVYYDPPYYIYYGPPAYPHPVIIYHSYPHRPGIHVQRVERPHMSPPPGHSGPRPSMTTPKPTGPRTTAPPGAKPSAPSPRPSKSR